MCGGLQQRIGGKGLQTIFHEIIPNMFSWFLPWPRYKLSNVQCARQDEGKLLTQLVPPPSARIPLVRIGPTPTNSLFVANMANWLESTTHCHLFNPLMNNFELKTLKLLANLNFYVVLVYLFRPFQSVSVELTKPPNFRNDFNQSAFLWCVGVFLKKSGCLWFE